jgi:hypothetical protein
MTLSSREVLNNILIEFGINMKLVKLIKIWNLHKVRIGKNLLGEL